MTLKRTLHQLCAMVAVMAVFGVALLQTAAPVQAQDCINTPISNDGYVLKRALISGGNIAMFESEDKPTNYLGHYSTQKGIEFEKFSIDGADVSEDRLVYVANTAEQGELIIKNLGTGEIETQLTSTEGDYFLPGISGDYVWFVWRSKANPQHSKIYYMVRGSQTPQEAMDIPGSFVLYLKGSGNHFTITFVNSTTYKYTSVVFTIKEDGGYWYIQMNPKEGNLSVSNAYADGNYAAFQANNTIYLFNMTSQTANRLFTPAEGQSYNLFGISEGRILYMLQDTNTDIYTLRYYDIATMQSKDVFDASRIDFSFLLMPKIEGNYIAFTRKSPFYDKFLYDARIYDIAADSARGITKNISTDARIYLTDVDKNANLTYIVADGANYDAFVNSCQPAPAAFDLVSPQGDETITGSHTFQWTRSEHALNYRLMATLHNSDAAISSALPQASQYPLDVIIPASACDMLTDLCEYTADLSHINSGVYIWGVVASNFNGLTESNLTNTFMYQGNVLQNGDFEAPLAPAWAKTNIARQKCNTDTRNFAFEGNCVLLLRADSRVVQTVTDIITTNDLVSFSAVARESAAAIGKIKVRIIPVDTTQPVGKMNINLVGGAYTFYEKSLTYAPDISKIKVTMLNRGTGKVFVDAARLSVEAVALRAANVSTSIDAPLIDLPEAPDGFRR